MPRYLLSLALGPVQEFIAAARRTRDLWYGSYLLSEISKAAALNLRQRGANLIFPAPENSDRDLEPNSPLNVANKILAEMDTDDPVTALAMAKAAAQHRWGDLAQQSLDELRKKTRKDFQIEFHVQQDLWHDQAKDLLEMFAAWAPLDGDYKKARQRVESLLAARKGTRDFVQPGLPDRAYGIPKSSLDGKRESVLPEAQSLPQWAKRKLGLNVGEHLDCPGVVKRLGGDENDTQKFTSIARIAIDPWLRKIEADGIDLPGIRSFLEPLVGFGLTTRVKGNEGIYASLPYDGQMLYPFRLEAECKALEKWAKRTNDDRERQEIRHAMQALNALRRHMLPIWRECGQPNPYVAVLLADGDRIGAMLDDLADADHHRRASQALAKFAQRVPEMVRERRGHCIYAGGDDVLALAPIDGGIDCARALHDYFGKRLELPFAKEAKPSLSVGIAIGHFLEPMGSLLNLARRAEKLAKGRDDQRDGLGIIWEPRSGAPIEMRDQWSNDPDLRLQRWVAAFGLQEIPGKVPYELRELAREMDWAKPPLLMQEMQRILKRKRAGLGTCPISQERLDQLLDPVQTSIEGKGLPLRAFVDELLIAKHLSQSL